VSEMNCHPDRSEAKWRDLRSLDQHPTQTEAPLLFIPSSELACGKLREKRHGENRHGCKARRADR
jgi:hypothetical protein